MPLLKIFKKDKEAAAAAAALGPDVATDVEFDEDGQPLVESATTDDGNATPALVGEVVDDFEPEPHEMRAGGGLRKDEDGEEYWLNLDRIREYNRMDDTITDNDEFWTWFKNARDAWGIKGRGKNRKRGRVDASHWDFEHYAGGSTWKPKYLSDGWGGAGYFSGTKNDEIRKLAVAVQAVQTVIRVIDSHERRMWVHLSVKEEAGQPKSFTNYENREIQVSPMALLDKNIEQGEGIDITTGFALHEASHAEYSEMTLAALRQPTLLRPVMVVGLLHNILEDVRIEALTTDAWTGFGGYFEKALAYLWDIQKAHAPKAWGPSLEEMLKAIILAVKWPTEFSATAAAIGGSAGPVLLVEGMWWQAWMDAYKDGSKTMRQSIQDGLARLEADPDTKKQLDALKAEEEAAEKVIGRMNTPEGIRKMIEEMLKRHGMGGFEVCASPEWGTGVPGGGKSKAGIGASEAAEVERLVKSEIEASDAGEMKIPSMGKHNPTIVTLHPPEEPETKKRYKVADPVTVARMKSAFFFRPSAMTHSTRLQRTGQVDEPELWRAGVGDYRVFERTTTESTPDTSVSLLIDASGSMIGYAGAGGSYRTGGETKVQVAIELTQILLACLRDMNGVKVRVRAHTGDNSDNSSGAALFKIWDQGDPLSRVQLISAIDHGNNYDGYAIGACVKELLTDRQEQKVLIVLSDGYPAGSGYGGTAAHNHMKATNLWAERNGVMVVQIAIDPHMDPERQAAMFKHWVPFESREKLPMQMAQLLRKIFPGR